MFDADHSLRLAVAGVALLIGLGCIIAWLPARRRDPAGLWIRLLVTAGLIMGLADLGGLGGVLGFGLAAMGGLLAWEAQPPPEVPRPHRGGIVVAAVLTGIAGFAVFEGWGGFARLPAELRAVATLVVAATGALACMAIADRARVRLRVAVRLRFNPPKPKRRPPRVDADMVPAAAPAAVLAPAPRSIGVAAQSPVRPAGPIRDHPPLPRRPEPARNELTVAGRSGSQLRDALHRRLAGPDETRVPGQPRHASPALAADPKVEVREALRRRLAAVRSRPAEDEPAAATAPVTTPAAPVVAPVAAAPAASPPREPWAVRIRAALNKALPRRTAAPEPAAPPKPTQPTTPRHAAVPERPDEPKPTAAPAWTEARDTLRQLTAHRLDQAEPTERTEQVAEQPAAGTGRRRATVPPRGAQEVAPWARSEALRRLTVIRVERLDEPAPEPVAEPEPQPEPRVVGVPPGTPPPPPPPAP